MAALKGKALIAYLVVCVLWGSTYLAIKVGVTELPPFLFAGLRFLVAGLILLALARALGDPLPRKGDWRTLAIVGLLLLGEWPSWHLSTRGIGAIAYLVVFGSILGYSAYSYALRHASATIVGTYAYVNPVIAVLLGWLLLHEAVHARTFIAMGMILVAVVWIQFSHKLRRSDGLTSGRPQTASDQAVRPSGRPGVDPEPEAST